ncbi:MAG TPA: shikimate kinase [Atopostipes sp.]|nr:shikimate kinase [Atopostipes sp.]
MKENLVLIGMPGSGKSTIGRILGEKLGLLVIDLDKEIEKHAGQSIPSLFKKGEAHFRVVESEVAEIFSEQSPLVIATGGGIILKDANMDALSKNGTIIFLNRSLENITSDVDTNSRPLLKEGVEKLQQLYNERMALYFQYADLVIENNERPDAAIKQIMKKLFEEEKGSE